MADRPSLPSPVSHTSMFVHARGRAGRADTPRGRDAHTGARPADENRAAALSSEGAELAVLEGGSLR